MSTAGWTVLREDAEPPCLVVCEQAGRWAVAIRRAWPAAGPIAQTRSLTECWERLARAPSSLVVVELAAANLDPLLDRLVRLPRDFPLARMAIVASAQWGRYEWLLREAGAVHFVVGRRRVAALAALARRHLDKAPRPPEDLLGRLVGGLPWSRHATALSAFRGNT